jgi:DNA-binding NtrC family response regulator
MIQNGTQEQTVQALKAGAADYFDYSAQPHDVVQSVKKLNDEFNARFKNVGGQVVPINAAPKLTVIQGQGGTSTVSELPKVTQGPGEGYMDMKKKWIDAFEREYLTGILERHQGNVSASAREAKLDRSNFLRLLRRHGLKAQVFRTEEQNVSAAKAA